MKKNVLFCLCMAGGASVWCPEDCKIKDMKMVNGVRVITGHDGKPYNATQEEIDTWMEQVYRNIKVNCIDHIEVVDGREIAIDFAGEPCDVTQEEIDKWKERVRKIKEEIIALTQGRLKKETEERQTQQ